MSQRKPHPYYDKNRPASLGRWVATLRKSDSFVQVESFQTEHQAREAMGLRGGSKDPRYVPAEAA